MFLIIIIIAITDCHVAIDKHNADNDQCQHLQTFITGTHVVMAFIK